MELLKKILWHVDMLTDSLKEAGQGKELNPVPSRLFSDEKLEGSKRISRNLLNQKNGLTKPINYSPSNISNDLQNHGFLLQIHRASMND